MLVDVTEHSILFTVGPNRPVPVALTEIFLIQFKVVPKRA